MVTVALIRFRYLTETYYLYHHCFFLLFIFYLLTFNLNKDSKVLLFLQCPSVVQSSHPPQRRTAGYTGVMTMCSASSTRSRTTGHSSAMGCGRKSTFGKTSQHRWPMTAFLSQGMTATGNGGIWRYFFIIISLFCCVLEFYIFLLYVMFYYILLL